jgi:hypothetical protein
MGQEKQRQVKAQEVMLAPTQVAQMDESQMLVSCL